MRQWDYLARGFTISLTTSIYYFATVSRERVYFAKGFPITLATRGLFPKRFQYFSHDKGIILQTFLLSFPTLRRDYFAPYFTISSMIVGFFFFPACFTIFPKDMGFKRGFTTSRTRRILCNGFQYFPLYKVIEIFKNEAKYRLQD